MKICYLLHNSSDTTEEVTLQSELACVSHAITRLRAVSSHSSCTDYHQKENMPLNILVTHSLFFFFWYPLTFSHCFAIFFSYFSPFPFLYLFLSSSPNFLVSEFPSHDQAPCFPSTFSFFSQTSLDCLYYSNIITSDSV